MCSPAWMNAHVASGGRAHGGATVADLRVPHCEVLTAQSLVRDARAALDAAAVAVVPGTTRT